MAPISCDDCLRQASSWRSQQSTQSSGARILSPLASLTMIPISNLEVVTGHTLPNQPRLRTVPLPRISSNSVAIHPVLAYGSQWLIEHDITKPPSSAVLHSPSFGASLQWLSENASTPGLPYLTIRIQPIEKILVVYPVNQAADTVTISDVLHAVFEAVHTAVLYVPDQSSHLLSPAYDECQHGMSALSLGPRHASKAMFHSLLNGRQMWGGLSASTHETDVWVLHTK